MVNGQWAIGQPDSPIAHCPLPIARPPGHERPPRSAGVFFAHRQQLVGALDWGMGPVCCGGGYSSPVRWHRSILLSLLCGAALNLLLAWGFALWAKPRFAQVWGVDQSAPAWMKFEVPADWLEKDQVGAPAGIAYSEYEAAGATPRSCYWGGR